MQFISKHKYPPLPLYFKEDVFIFMFFCHQYTLSLVKD